MQACPVVYTEQYVYMCGGGDNGELMTTQDLIQRAHILTIASRHLGHMFPSLGPVLTCRFTSNDPFRVSQDVSGSGCGPATGWFLSLCHPRRFPPCSLCASCMHFFTTTHCFRSFLSLLGPCSKLLQLCLRRNLFFFPASLPEDFFKFFKTAFYVLLQIRSRNRNRNLSKVRIGTVTCQKSEPEP